MKFKIFLLILASSFSFPVSILAQNALGLTAIPPRLEITAEPGTAVTREIKIRNESSTTKVVNLSPRDIIVIDDFGTPVQLENVAESENRWAASSWIMITPSRLTLQPGETKNAFVTVDIPANALPGGHYAIVLNSPDNEVFLNSTGASVQANVGNLVYITVPGDITQNAKIKQFSAPKFSEYGPVDFKTTITNLSDIHIAPAGAINVTNWLGSKTARLDLKANNIFPYTSLNYDNTLDKKFLFGRYKAQLITAYGTAGGTLVATIFFWVIPWRLLLALLFGIISLVLLWILFKKKDTLLAQTEQIDDLEKELEALRKKYKDRK
jgi:hypothetical protein